MIVFHKPPSYPHFIGTCYIDGKLTDLKTAD